MTCWARRKDLHGQSNQGDWCPNFTERCATPSESSPLPCLKSYNIPAQYSAFWRNRTPLSKVALREEMRLIISLRKLVFSLGSVLSVLLFLPKTVTWWESLYRSYDCMGSLHESVHVASLWSVTRVSSPRKEWENILTTRDHLHRSSARVSVLAPPPEQHVLHQCHWRASDIREKRNWILPPWQNCQALQGINEFKKTRAF